MSSSIGKLLTLTTFGESHGTALGGIIDGYPSGIEIDEEFIRSEMARRRPGSTELGTQRNEDDIPRILSGVFEGISTGTPIGFIIENKTQRSADYGEIAHKYRPGHADYTYDAKYGIRDYRGGGRSSGRETACRVFGGALAKLILRKEGIRVDAGVIEAGGIKAVDYKWDPPFKGPLYAPENPNTGKPGFKKGLLGIATILTFPVSVPAWLLYQKYKEKHEGEIKTNMNFDNIED